MAGHIVSGFQELTIEWRHKRDGKDCAWNVIVTVAEARGLRGLGNHGLNDCRLKVFISTADDDEKLSKIHEQTSTPFFDQVFKLTFEGQPAAFFSAFIEVQILHERGAIFPQNIIFPPKLIGMLQVGILDVFQMPDHKLPMQWFAIVDLNSEEPAIPRGFLRMSIIVNSLDEPGAVQIEVPPRERNEKELLIIPRIHACATSTGAYNIIFKIYQARDLRRMDALWGADSYIRISCSSGEIRTDTKNGTLDPKWNQQVQLPIYEPLFREVIRLEVWHDSATGPILMSCILFTWKDIVSNQDLFKQIKWYDMYDLPEESFGKRILNNRLVKSIGRQTEDLGTRLRSNQFMKWVAKNTEAIVGDGMLKTGMYQESSIYCGRVLLSLSIEDRSLSVQRADQNKPPSMAQTDMKPKDCVYFQDVHQKAFFRFQVFFAQGLPVPFGIDSLVQVELSIGGKAAATSAVRSASDGLFHWYESVELEIDMQYDDKLWPWSCDKPDSDYEQGLVPSLFIDEGIPDAWIKVYRCNSIGSMNAWTNEQTRRLIGFNRCSIRKLLNLGVSRSSGGTNPRNVDNISSEGIDVQDDESPDKRNLILNQKQSSQPAFSLKDADKIPRFFDPATFQGRTKCSLDCPAWPAPHGAEYIPEPGSVWPNFDDKRENKNSMDPYIGVQCFNLERDGTCALEDGDFPGRIWVSCKCYLPSRENCKSALKGPPILSPFTKYNKVKIPAPHQMAGCTQRFSLLCHIFQASDLPASNEVGIADSYVEVLFMDRKKRTHTVYGSNSPTWDVTLAGGTLNEVEIPCLGWPGRRFTYDDLNVQSEYEVGADPGESYNAIAWRRNQDMLRFVPWIEVRVVETSGVLLGRCFVDPSTCRHTLQDPQWYELFKGNPDLDEGKILVSMQLIHKTDPLLANPVIEPYPIRTERPDKDDDFSSDRDRVGTHIDENKSKTKRVIMRDCRVQIQILGLRDIDQSVELRNPSIAVFIQTTDRWDADKGFSFLSTQCKGGDGDHQNQNFMETLELKVQLPDDIEYAPSLEFALFDDRGTFSWTKTREIVAWGSLQLSDLYPQGNSDAATAEIEEEEEDIAAIQRQQAKELSKQFQGALQDFEAKQTIDLKDSKKLKKAYYEATNGENPAKVAAKMLVEAPSEDLFVFNSESHLLKDDNKSKNSTKIEKKEAEIDTTQQQTGITENPSSHSVSVQSATTRPAGPVAPNRCEPLNTLMQPVELQKDAVQGTTEQQEIEEADAGPCSDHIQVADTPLETTAMLGKNLLAQQKLQNCDNSGPDSAGDEGPLNAEEDVFGGTDHIEPNDDEDADLQEVIDTPDGKPSAEWLIFRRNKLYNEPLENTEEWRKNLLDSFDEIALFRGRVKDYKRREASKIGMIKCLVKLFRKEDEDEKGKSKRSLGKKDATFCETLKSDPNMEKALDMARAYRMYNIFELYPDVTVDVRLYCLKAIQVTPGGFKRIDSSGAPYWNHYLECRLASQKYESDVANKLNPNFFHIFEIKGITLPGPSQLVLALKDGELYDGSITDSRLIGETSIDLEDRWFCSEWRDLIHKPREVRDLVNEKDQPGISQGKLLVVLDIVEEVLVEDTPPMDIKVTYHCNCFLSLLRRYFQDSHVS